MDFDTLDNVTIFRYMWGIYNLLNHFTESTYNPFNFINGIIVELVWKSGIHNAVDEIPQSPLNSLPPQQTRLSESVWNYRLLQSQIFEHSDFSLISKIQIRDHQMWLIFCIFVSPFNPDISLDLSGPKRRKRHDIWNIRLMDINIKYNLNKNSIHMRVNFTFRIIWSTFYLIQNNFFLNQVSFIIHLHMNLLIESYFRVNLWE